MTGPAEPWYCECVEGTAGWKILRPASVDYCSVCREFAPWCERIVGDFTRQDGSRSTEYVVADLRAIVADREEAAQHAIRARIVAETSMAALRETIESILSPRSAHMSRDAIRERLREALDV